MPVIPDPEWLLRDDGIGVHRKRTQVAVIDTKSEVLTNRNVPNWVEPILQVIGGPPTAFEGEPTDGQGVQWPRVPLRQTVTGSLRRR